MFGFVTHCHTHLGGKCPHRCTYCYVMNSPQGKMPKYEGDLRMVDKELRVAYGTGRTIFVEHCTDLFAEAVPAALVNQVLGHCREYPDNTYLFHTKNPARYREFEAEMPSKRILGATVETNRPTPGISTAPAPLSRLQAMASLTGRKLITIEPVMEFDLEELAASIGAVNPEIVAIGADSKGTGLKEPGRSELVGLIRTLYAKGIKVKQKGNLGRLLV